VRTEPFEVRPQCQEYYDVTPALVLSKELVVRRVVFDPRRRDGYPNATVFIMEAKGMTLSEKHFTGCQVGHFLSDRCHFRKPLNYPTTFQEWKMEVWLIYSALQVLW